jgi:D-xylose reductase
MAQSTVTLASGKEMPLVGFGLWNVPKETAAETVYNVSISTPNHATLNT